MPVGAAKLALSDHVAHNDWDTGTRVTRAAKYNQYSEVARSAVSYDGASIAGRTVWGGQAGAVRQCVSDER